MVTYIFVFIALYFEIFLLINYFEMEFKQKDVPQKIYSQQKLPTVSIIVPVWNEEKTVLKTIFSLLKLEYPKEKLSILIVDDGSTDNTYSVIQRFKNHKQVKILKKENGGKHTALNYALDFVQTDLVGCLDADSFVHPKALMRIVDKFKDDELMAVTPSVKIFEPKGFWQLLQKAEYMFGIFLRRIFAYLNAIYITPGPFSIFRREVFDKIGKYKHAYNTEDLEIALRMQKNQMKIGNAHNAFVYTVAPNNLKKLYKQRLRWVYGFLRNAIDYRQMFFRKEYGHLGVVILPAAGFSVFSTLYFFVSAIYSWIEFSLNTLNQFLTVGLFKPSFSFDLFYWNTDILVFVSAIAVLGTFFIIVTSRKMAEEEGQIGLDSLLFIAFYVLIAPIWMIKAVYNLVFAKTTKWR